MKRIVKIGLVLGATMLLGFSGCKTQVEPTAVTLSGIEWGGAPWTDNFCFVGGTILAPIPQVVAYYSDGRVTCKD